LTINDFQVFINGLSAEPTSIDSIVENVGNVEIDFNNGLGYTITEGMEITAVGKFIV